MAQTAKTRRNKPDLVTQVLALLLLIGIAFCLRKWWGFEETATLLLVLIWHALPSKADIREIIEESKEQQP